MPITVMSQYAHRRKGVETPRTQTTIAVLAAVALAAVGLAFLRPGAPGAPTPRLGSADGPANAPAAPEQPAPASIVVRDPLPLPERALEKLETSTLDDLSPEDRAAYEEYVAKAKATVSDHSSELKSLLESYLAALVAGDAEALEPLAASDEPTQPSALAQNRLAAQPRILRGQPLPTVQVRPYGNTTVYLAFALVVWRDGGLDSEHTIAVPLRYTASGWKLTSFDPLHDPRGQVVTEVTNAW